MKSLSFCDLDQVITVEPGCYFIDALLTKTRDDPISSKFFNWQEVEKYKSFGGVRIESDVVCPGSSKFYCNFQFCLLSFCSLQFPHYIKCSSSSFCTLTMIFSFFVVCDGSRMPEPHKLPSRDLGDRGCNGWRTVASAGFKFHGGSSRE